MFLICSTGQQATGSPGKKCRYSGVEGNIGVKLSMIEAISTSQMGSLRRVMSDDGSRIK